MTNEQFRSNHTSGGYSSGGSSVKDRAVGRATEGDEDEPGLFGRLIC